MLPQARLEEKEAAERKAGKAESEVAELSKRLVEMKMTEIERMNEASAMRQPKHLHASMDSQLCHDDEKRRPMFQTESASASVRSSVGHKVDWRPNGLALQLSKLSFSHLHRQTACTMKWSRARARWRGQQLPAQQGGSWGGSSRCLQARSR